MPKINAIISVLTLLVCQTSIAEVWPPADPEIGEDEAIEMIHDNGESGYWELEIYERTYGKLNESQRDQFIWELKSRRSAEYNDWIWEQRSQEPLLMWKTAGISVVDVLKIIVSKATQTMQVLLNGVAIPGLAKIKVSTGKKGSPTPSGVYDLKKKEIVKRRLNQTFTKKLGRKVWLEDAIQISGGIFFHKASTGAQNHLGSPRSAGCVRVDRDVSAKFFETVRRYAHSTTIVIQ